MTTSASTPEAHFVRKPKEIRWRTVSASLGANLSNTNLVAADLGHAYLHAANLQGAWLCRTILSHANLEAARLEGSHSGTTSQFPEGFAAEARGVITDPACAEARFVSGCEHTTLEDR